MLLENQNNKPVISKPAEQVNDSETEESVQEQVQIEIRADTTTSMQLPKSHKIGSTTNSRYPGSIDEDVRIKLPSDESSQSPNHDQNQNLNFVSNTKSITESVISNTSPQNNQIAKATTQIDSMLPKVEERVLSEEGKQP